MHKERLFEYIRNEEVVIWAGAGMSLYAGYPSGQKLTNTFYSNLNNEENIDIPKNLTLQNITEELHRMRGSKNSLFKLLEKEFVNHIPTSTEYHDKIATIPHFKTIITTNYDKLFENAYHNKCTVVTKSHDISYLSPEKIHILKIHGDLDNKDGLIITQTDYNNFFKNNSENNILWTYIKSIIATKNILFLGYGYEDPNVSVIFDKILDELGDHRKEIFFAAPNQSKYKVKYLDKKNIHYIDSNSENLIDELIGNIKENIIDDFKNKKVSVETFRNFLGTYELIPNLKGNEHSYVLTSLEGLKGKIPSDFKLTFQYNENLVQELNSFIQGKKFGEFEISKEQISNLLVTSNGIKIISKDNIEKFTFKSRPSYSGKFDIKFIDGFEIFDLEYKIYGSPNKIEIHINYKSVDIIITYIPSSEDTENIPLNFKYLHHEMFRRTSEEIEILTFIKKLFSNVEFNIFKDDINIFTKSIFLPQMTEEIDFSLDFFMKLKIIEDYYKIRFSNLNTLMITDDVYDEVDLISSIIEKGEKIYNKSYTLNFDADNDKIKQEINEVINGAPIEVEHNTPEDIEILGQKINLGYKKITFLEPEIVNIKEIENKTNQTIIIDSKKIKITYNPNAKPS